MKPLALSFLIWALILFAFSVRPQPEPPGNVCPDWDWPAVMAYHGTGHRYWCEGGEGYFERDGESIRLKGSSR